MKLLALRVGDGHERTEDILIRVNRSSIDIETAYRAGVEVCEVNIRDWNFDDEESLSEDFSLLSEIDMYAEIYLRIAQLGDADLKYETVDDDENPVLCIGGYGLFSL